MPVRPHRHRVSMDYGSYVHPAKGRAQPARRRESADSHRAAILGHFARVCAQWGINASRCDDGGVILQELLVKDLCRCAKKIYRVAVPIKEGDTLNTAVEKTLMELRKVSA